MRNKPRKDNTKSIVAAIKITTDKIGRNQFFKKIIEDYFFFLKNNKPVLLFSETS